MAYKISVIYKPNTSEKLNIASEFIKRIREEIRTIPTVTIKDNEYIIEFEWDGTAENLENAKEEMILDLKQLFLTKITYPDNKVEYIIQTEKDTDITEFLEKLTIEGLKEDLNGRL